MGTLKEPLKEWRDRWQPWWNLSEHQETNESHDGTCKSTKGSMRALIGHMRTPRDPWKPWGHRETHHPSLGTVRASWDPWWHLWEHRETHESHDGTCESTERPISLHANCQSTKRPMKDFSHGLCKASWDTSVTDLLQFARHTPK